MIIALGIIGAPVAADEYTIDNSTTITATIAAAAPGDTIINLDPGIYFEHDIILDRNLIIRANTAAGGSAANTIINATKSGRIFGNSGGHALTIDNLTLQDGHVGGGGAQYGGAIYAGTGSAVTITSSIITDCEAEGAGAVWIYEGTLTITASTITRCSATNGPGGAVATQYGSASITSSTIADCSATHDGGAIYAASTLTITSSTFSNCSATFGGAILNMGGTTVTSSTFSNCSSIDEGGAIHNSAIHDGENLTITSSTFSNCSATFGGAIQNSEDLTITSSTFSNCSATLGGAVINTGDLTITSSTFSNCSATSHAGAIRNFGDLTIVTSTFDDCSAAGYGGAISSTGNRVSITGSTVTNCSATQGDGGAIWSNSADVAIGMTTFTGCSASGDGGAIYTDGGTLGIGNDAFTDCTAAGNGGAINSVSSPTTIFHTDFTNCSATAGSGGAVWTSGDPLTIYDTLWFTSCSAGTDGGAVYHDGVPVDISIGAVFVLCSAGGNGGAIAGTGPVSVDFCWFTDCSAANGGAIAGTGDITITGTHFTGNSASADGGAISGGGGTLDVTTSNIVYCTAGGRGGAFFTTGPGTLHYNRLYGNTATGSGPVIFASSAVDATDNWWGSNNDPSPQVSGPVTNGPWLVLGITADPAAIMTTENSTIRTNLTWNSAGTNTSAGGHVMDYIITNWYAVTAGSGSVSPNLDHTANGVAETTFTPQYGGTVTISGTVDDQTVYISLPVTPVPGPTPPIPVPTYNQYDTGSSNSDFPPSAFPLMTVTVNIGGDSKAWQAIVTGTKLSGLIVTGTVQHGAGDNVTAPPGIIFQYISLVPARYDTITNTVVNFTVPQSWLDENNITPESIVLYRLTSNGWEALPTTVLHTKDGTVYFSAQSGGFSLFAIAGTPAAATPVTIATTQGMMPGNVQEQAPAALRQKPVVTETTAVPAPAEIPAGSSGIPVVPALVVLGCVGLVGGGWYVRRWWIQRQNPALFKEYD